jgi:ribosomal-protein-serine acetyltransferase
MNLPASVETPRLRLRLWTADDAEALARAVAESLEHLRPWMSWTADEPLSVAARLALIERFQATWAAGGDVVYGAFLADHQNPGSGTVIGGCGFNRRAEASVLEIGYWVHVDHLHQGYASELAAALTEAAFTLDGIEQLEIHHDRANHRSRAVPARLGYSFEGERPDAVLAPGEEGIDCRWVMARSEFHHW